MCTSVRQEVRAACEGLSAQSHGFGARGQGGHARAWGAAETWGLGVVPEAGRADPAACFQEHFSLLLTRLLVLKVKAVTTHVLGRTGGERSGLGLEGGFISSACTRTVCL